MIKAEGVEDCVKWLKKRMKETKKELDMCNDWDMSARIFSKLKEQISIKISLEKYMKKLRHEAKEISM